MTSERPSAVRGGRYQVVRELGRGGQGATFEAIDRDTGARVALKEFRVRGASSWKEVELAEREAKVLAGLSHPLLPRYLDHFEEGGALYLVTDRVDGESLAALAASGARFEPSDAVRLLEDLAEILAYLHGRSPPVIHRDIKPGNVIKRRDGRYALVDFGAVRDHLRPEGGSTVVGTFGYMAPEQFQGRAMAGSDVYGAAATALWMLTGTEPEALPHRGLGIDVAAALPRGTDPELVRVLASALTPDPDLRPTSLTPLVARVRARERPDPSRAGAPRQPHVSPGHASSSTRDGGAFSSDGGAFSSWPRRESKRDKKERKRREKEARWNERRQRKSGGRIRAPGRGLSGPLLAVVLVALIIAQIAVLVGLCAIVPAILHALAPFTSPSLKRAAGQSYEAGRRASAAIEQAKSLVRGSQADRPVTTSPVAGAGLRIDPTDSARDLHDLEAEAEAEAEATRDAERAQADDKGGRRQRRGE